MQTGFFKRMQTLWMKRAIALANIGCGKMVAYLL